MLKGIAASPGISIGEALIYSKQELKIENIKINVCEVEDEIKRFEKAKDETKAQLEMIKDKAEQTMSEKEAQVFKAHIMVLEDATLYKKITNNIMQNMLSAEAACEKAMNDICIILENLKDDYMRERAVDIKDVVSRLISNLAGINNLCLNDLERDVIVVCEDLTPSDTMQMDLDKILGVVTDIGGRTSHTAIIARTLEIPAVVGSRIATCKISNGDLIIVDGISGEVIINPKENEIKFYSKKREDYLLHTKELEELKNIPTVTKDFRKLELCANIGSPKDIEGAIRNDAEGVGLYRTEFLYMDRKCFPTEDEQFEAYKEVALKMGNKPVIIRTLDIGGDKELSYINFEKEQNPFLGWRAIRMCLDMPEVLKVQLRAILKASHYGNLLIMYPMITGIEEIRKANKILEEAKGELLQENISFDEKVKVGIMIETPAAALMSDKLIKEVDFFSIGTNDLTQYTLAVDRGNEKISNLYQPFHPAVLRLIKKVIDASHSEGKWTGMCGEMAGNEKAALLLLGMGLDEFSMSSISILKVRKVLLNSSFEEMKIISEKVLELDSVDEVIEFIDKGYK